MSVQSVDGRGMLIYPLGAREDFSYGALLSSLVGWLGYGGHVSWAKQRYLVETFLTYAEVKPDNNDAERGLHPVVLHRKVSGGARSHWGGQLVAMMSSFLETMRLQGKNAVEELFKLLAIMGRPPPTPQQP